MSEFTKQITKILSQLSLVQKIVVGAAVAAVVGGILAIALFSGKVPMQLLYGRLGDKDMAEVVALVQSKGIKYEVGPGGNSIYVPADQVYPLRAELASKGVPAGDSVGFEIFDRSNFGISDFVQRANYIRAVQGELQRTISEFSGVRSARVMIVPPENRLVIRGDTRSKPKASVMVEAGSGALGKEAVNAIRFLVANSVEGLSPNDVVVVDNHGNVLTEMLNEDTAVEAVSNQMRIRREFETHSAQKIESMLARVLGEGNAVVRVSAEVDAETSTKQQELYDPDVTVVRNEVISDDSIHTSEGVRENRATGVSANVPAPVTPTGESAATPGKVTEQSRRNRTNQYEINKTTITTAKPSGTIRKVSAAVFIAQKDKPRTPEEMAALQKIVASALGIYTDSKELARSITIEEVPFSEVTQPAESPLADRFYQNESLIRNVGALAVGLIAIWIFRRMLKNAKSEQISMEVLGNQPVVTDAAVPQKMAISPDMLNEMIRQKPANVGAALRSWMSDGSTIKD